jgi:hypothetical protein
VIQEISMKKKQFKCFKQQLKVQVFTGASSSARGKKKHGQRNVYYGNMLLNMNRTALWLGRCRRSYEVDVKNEVKSLYFAIYSPYLT